MDSGRVVRLATSLSSTGTRRRLVRLLAAIPLGVTLTTLLADAPDATAKPKAKGVHKKQTCRDCCRTNGNRCTRKSNRCKRSLCQPSSTTTPLSRSSGGRHSAPLTIEAVWASDRDHDTYLFIPNEAGSTLPAPWINHYCTPENTDCEDNVYPFACVSQDATGPGDEITTVRRLLSGIYEYWIELDVESPAGDVTVNLKNSDGSVVRSWSSPPNPNPDLGQASIQLGWHVFTVDGDTGAITSVDELSDHDLPEVAHNPSTDVCPG